MNKLVLSFFILLAQSLVFSQESLEPLGTNYQLIKQNRISSYDRSSPVENNDFIYLTDTLHLPIVDDFSTDKYKQFDADVNDVSVSDSIWYALFDVNGNPISNFEVKLEPLTFFHSIPPILKIMFFLNILLIGKANAPVSLAFG